MVNFQRENALSNTQVGNDFEDLAWFYFSKEIPLLKRPFIINIGHTIKKPHKFDFGSLESKVIVECKAHTWTSGGNTPSAKLTTWDQAMLYFYLAPRGYRKIFLVQKDVNPKTKESLSNYYLRTHKHLIPDEVEFWEVDEGTKRFEMVNTNLIES